MTGGCYTESGIVSTVLPNHRSNGKTLKSVANQQPRTRETMLESARTGPADPPNHFGRMTLQPLQNDVALGWSNFYCLFLSLTFSRFFYLLARTLASGSDGNL
ncbi:hypothetical protein BJX96DRAFT_6028 [Aspergillus floccosus]